MLLALTLIINILILVSWAAPDDTTTSSFLPVITKDWCGKFALDNNLLTFMHAQV